MIYSLQGLRIIATLLIFVFHSGFLFVSAFPVTLFFMLSGFFYYFTFGGGKITLSQSVRYALRRFVTFYPLYLLTFLMSLFIRHDWLADRSVEYLMSAVPLDLLMLKSLFPAYTFQFNGLSWYLSTLLLIYLIAYPFTCFVHRLQSVFGASLALVAVMFLQFVLLSMEVIPSPYTSPFYRVTDFLLGMILAKMYIDGYRFSMPHVTLISLFLFMLCFVVDLLWQWNSYCLYNPSFVLLILALLSYPSKLKTWFEHPLLVKLAAYSFSFYMFHELFLIIFREVFSTDHFYMGHIRVNMLVMAVCAFLLTSLAVWLFNKPLNALSRKLIKTYF